MAFDFHIQLNRTNELLERIAAAVERIAGPIPPDYHPPIPATIRDLVIMDPAQAEEVKKAEEWFAITNMVAPGSEAFMQKVAEFEQMVLLEAGEKALEELPWRKLNR